MKILIIASVLILSACGVSTSQLSSDTPSELDVGKYRVDVDIPVYASVNLKVVNIPPIKSQFTPSLLLEKFEDGTSAVKVCALGEVDMGGTKVTYERVEDAYNTTQAAQLGTTYLIDIPKLKATGKVSGFTVKIKSQTKLTLDLEFSKNEDGTFSARGTDKTNLDYADVFVTPPSPFSYLTVKASSKMEKDSSQHKFSIEKLSDDASCADLK